MEMPSYYDLMTMSEQDLRLLSDRVWEAIKAKCDVADRQKAFELQEGDIVEWDSRRRGYGVLVGKVVHKKIKNAVIDAGIHGKWNVPMGVLRKTNKEFKSLKESVDNLTFRPKVDFPFDKSGELAKAFGETGRIGEESRPATKEELRKDMPVEFTHPKKGVMRGVIVRVKRKKVIVDTGDTKKWDVPLDMLRRVIQKHPSIGKTNSDAEVFTTDDIPEHDCWENAGPYKSDGALGHGFECKICGKFLQAG